LKNWQKCTYAATAGGDLRSLATFKDTSKHARKERQLSIARTKFFNTTGAGGMAAGDVFPTGTQ